MGSKIPASAGWGAVKTVSSQNVRQSKIPVLAGWGAVKMFQVNVLTKILLLLCTLHSVNATDKCFFCLSERHIIMSGGNIKQCAKCKDPPLCITTSYVEKKYGANEYVWKITSGPNHVKDFAFEEDDVVKNSWRKGKTILINQTVNSIKCVLVGLGKFATGEHLATGTSEIILHADMQGKFTLNWDVDGKPGVSVVFKMPGIKNMQTTSYHTSDPPASNTRSSTKVTKHTGSNMKPPLSIEEAVLRQTYKPQKPYTNTTTVTTKTETVTTVTSPSHEPSQPRKTPRTNGATPLSNRQASNDGTGNDENSGNDDSDKDNWDNWIWYLLCVVALIFLGLFYPATQRNRALTGV